MPTKCWKCVTCEALYPTLEEASECEVSHPTKEKFSIQGVTYKSSRYIPAEVVIRFSEEQFDYGLYQLVRLGPKGL